MDYDWLFERVVGLDASFGNMYDWERILEKAVELNSTKSYVQIVRHPVIF
jgi:hypothetical protein